jgi:molybdenum cofactor cytidylyltransferase
MGGLDKLLEPVENVALLRMVAQRALASAQEVAVTLRPNDTKRKAALEGLRLTLLPVPDAGEGMAASLRAGAAWADRIGATALMIALPDMPDITAADMQELIAAQARVPDLPLRACTPTKEAGHPVILPRACFERMLILKGDEGARKILASLPVQLHPLTDSRARIDLDTPEAWAKWRAARPTSALSVPNAAPLPSGKRPLE